MTSKEIIQKHISKENPERIGFSFNEPHENDLPFVGYVNLINKHPELADWGYHECLLEQVKGFNGQVYLDEFGTIWGRLDELTLGEPVLGFLQTGPDDWARQIFLKEGYY